MIDAQLLGTMYEAALQPGKWKSVVQGLLQEIGVPCGALCTANRHDPKADHELLATAGFPDEHLRIYFEQWHEHNSSVLELMRRPPGSVFVDGRDLAPGELDDSRLYREYFRPNGLGHVMSAHLFSSGDRVAILALQQRDGRAGFSDRSIALFEAWVPHLARAVRLGDEWRRAHAMADQCMRALDRLPIAVLMTDRQGRLLRHNLAATTLLDHPHTPLQLRHGELLVPRAEHAAALRRLLAAASQVAGEPPSRQVVAGRLTAVDESYSIGLTAFAPPSSDGYMGDAADPIVLCLSMARHAQPLDMRLIALEFGLSPAEAEVAGLIGLGLSIDDVSARRKVGRETVKSQIKQVLGKTHTRNQVELVAMLMRSLATLRT